MRGRRLRHGRSSTTRSARTAVWDTARRKSLRRRMQQASTRLSERQGTQTPSLAPRAPRRKLSYSYVNESRGHIWTRPERIVHHSVVSSSSYPCTSCSPFARPRKARPVPFILRTSPTQSRRTASALQWNPKVVCDPDPSQSLKRFLRLSEGRNLEKQ
jgi:hypothetical protein